MNLYPFMKDARYVEIVEEYMNAYNYTLRQHKNQVIPEKIKEDAKNAVAKMKDDLDVFYRTKKKEIEDEKKKIRKAYKSKRGQYTNPQEEILKRQDFEMELMAASDVELANFLDDTDRTYTNFEIDRLHVEYRKRDMEGEATQMVAVKERLSYGKEYEKDSNYKLLDREDEFMLLAEPKGRNTLLYIPNGEKNTALYLDDIEKIALNPNVRKVSRSKLVGNQHANDAELIKDGHEILTKNIQTQNAWAAQFEEQKKKDVEEYRKEREKKGDPVKLKKYDDIDLRAIESSSSHKLEVEYDYLKERYNDDSNPLYNPGSEKFDIRKHMEYMRGKHREHLSANPVLKAAIQGALEAEEAEEAK